MTILLQKILDPGFRVDDANVTELVASAKSGELQPFVLQPEFAAAVNKMLLDTSVHPRMLQLAIPLADEMWIETWMDASNKDHPDMGIIECLLGVHISKGFVTGYLQRDNGKSAFAFRRSDEGAMLTLGQLDRMKQVEQNRYYIHSLILATLAIMNIPDAIEATPVRHDAKLQRSRVKRGALPLVEYKRVVMTKHRPHPAPEGDTDHSTGGKRRHHVIGHIRLRHADQPMGEWSWVRPHWRGDAGLGIVLKERVAE